MYMWLCGRLLYAIFFILVNNRFTLQVGRISYYDAKDIVLIPVPEYPIVLGDIKEDGPNASLYGEDGTLEVV